MPGIKEDDIDLKISDEGYLTISGEKHHSGEMSSKNNYFSEISYGMFKRTVPLPWDLDYNAAQAAYEDGILTVNIPKTQVEKQKYKKIPLKKHGTAEANA
jgi:HSP20 family protein